MVVVVVVVVVVIVVIVVVVVMFIISISLSSSSSSRSSSSSGSSSSITTSTIYVMSINSMINSIVDSIIMYIITATDGVLQRGAANCPDNSLDSGRSMLCVLLCCCLCVLWCLHIMFDVCSIQGGISNETKTHDLNNCTNGISKRRTESNHNLSA